jgi:putative membrane protein
MLTSFIIRTVISAIALLALANVSGNQIRVTDFPSAAVAAIVLGLANAVVKPILQLILGALTLPLSCITLGLWTLLLSWLINAILFYACAALLPGFDVLNFWAAMWGSLVLSCVNTLATVLTEKDKNDR